jgi:hypothetical protein
MSQAALDRKIVLGTDVAGFFLFHPNDMAHRARSPLAWYGYGFACRKEFEAGRMVTFCTGSDGTFAFRVTTGELSVREQRWLAASWDFRLRVRHGRVLLDNGDCLPNEDFCDTASDDDERWIDLPNGDYRVTVHAIDWGSEPGVLDKNGYALPHALTGYVIQFQRIDDIAQVPVASGTQPRLVCRKGRPASLENDWSEHETFEEGKAPLTADVFVLLQTPHWLVVPGFWTEFPVSDAVYEAVNGSVGSTLLPDRIESFVLAPAGAAPGQLAMLTRAGSACRSGNDPWSMTFLCRRLVRIAERFSDGEWEKARVDQVERAQETIDRDELKSLKAAFLAYAARDAEYRKKVIRPDFEAERVEAMDLPEGLTLCLIHHIQMPDIRRLDLLALPTARRVAQLKAILAAKETE